MMDGCGSAAPGQTVPAAVSVRDRRFGAKGNGIADDTKAIQAAVDAVSSVYIPPGTYIVSGSIVLPAGCRIRRGRRAGPGGAAVHAVGGAPGARHHPPGRRTAAGAAGRPRADRARPGRPPHCARTCVNAAHTGVCRARVWVALSAGERELRVEHLDRPPVEPADQAAELGHVASSPASSCSLYKASLSESIPKARVFRVTTAAGRIGAAQAGAAAGPRAAVGDSGGDCGPTGTLEPGPGCGRWTATPRCAGGTAW